MHASYKKAKSKQDELWAQLKDRENDIQELQQRYEEKSREKHRTHTSLAGQTPDDFGRLRERSTASLSNFIWKHHCNGLFVTPIPA